MSNVSIYEKNWIDLVFDGKNQQYGAYQLRKESSKISLLSLFFGTLLVGGIIALFTWSSIVSNTTESIIPIIEENEIIRVTKLVFP